jgi:hypothetical protein
MFIRSVVLDLVLLFKTRFLFRSMLMGIRSICKSCFLKKSFEKYRVDGFGVVMLMDLDECLSLKVMDLRFFVFFLLNVKNLGLLCVFDVEEGGIEDEERKGIEERNVDIFGD